MPNLFQNVSFAKHTPTYVGAPIEQFAKTAEVLNQRWEENKAAQDQLDVVLSNLKVEDADTPVLKARIDATRNAFKDVVKRNDFENAGNVVKKATKDFLTDNAVKAATENYAKREAIKQDLRQRYDKGDLSAAQYRDRTRRFNTYSGIGSPDELGFYQSYDFDYGVKKYDLDDFANKVLQGFKPDITSVEGQSINYGSDQNKAMGVSRSITTSGYSIADGTNAATVLDLALSTDQDALAYIDDEVRIHNEENPDSPITREQFIDTFAKTYVERESYSSKQSSTALTRDEDEIARARYKASLEAQEKGGVAAEQLYTENAYQDPALNAMIRFAKDQLSSRPQDGSPVIGFNRTNWYLGINSKNILTPEQSKEFNAIKTKVPGKDDKEKTINALNYLKNIQSNSKNVQYIRYDLDKSTKQSQLFFNNRASRMFYDFSTGKEVNGADLTDIEQKDFTVLGDTEYDNQFADRTDNPSYAIGKVVDIKGKRYIMGASTQELQSDEGILGQRINHFTSARRLGRTVKLDDAEINYMPSVQELGNRPAYKIKLPDGNISYIDTYLPNGLPASDLQIASAFYNLVNTK